MSPSGRFRRPARILDAATGGLSEQLARYKSQGSTILHHWQHSNSLWPGFFGVTSSPSTSLYPATSSLTDRSLSIPSEGIYCIAFSVKMGNCRGHRQKGKAVADPLNPFIM
jgi:hypothetical protein